MLDGIHVLNKIIETTNAKWGDWAVIITVIIGLILGLVFGMISEYKNEEIVLSIIVGMFLGFILGLFVFGISTQFQVPTGEYTYQVTIDNNVSMTEFNDKYDIIKQEGEIYYIKEKEDE